MCAASREQHGKSDEFRGPALCFFSPGLRIVARSKGAAHGIKAEDAFWARRSCSAHAERRVETLLDSIVPALLAKT
jgi:hypothetical protein